MRRGILALLACVSCLACADGELAEPKHNVRDIVGKTVEVASKEGVVLADYSVSSVSFDYVKRRWHVLYERKSTGLGDHFAITFDDDNERSELVRGL
jgi:hypothetical protein